MADDLRKRLDALRPKHDVSSPPTAGSSSRASTDDAGKRLEALGIRTDEEEREVGDDEVERYLRAMSPPDATPLDLPSLPPASSPSRSRLDASLDASDASLRTFTGPITEITFFPAPGSSASRDPEEEEALIKRLQDQLMIEGKVDKDLVKERKRVEERLAMLRGRKGGAEAEREVEKLGPPPTGDLSEFDLDADDAASSDGELER